MATRNEAKDMLFQVIGAAELIGKVAYLALKDANMLKNISKPKSMEMMHEMVLLMHAFRERLQLADLDPEGSHDENR